MLLKILANVASFTVFVSAFFGVELESKGLIVPRENEQREPRAPASVNSYPLRLPWDDLLLRSPPSYSSSASVAAAGNAAAKVIDDNRQEKERSISWKRQQDYQDTARMNGVDSMSRRWNQKHSKDSSSNNKTDVVDQKRFYSDW